jgi:hypothetical protein
MSGRYTRLACPASVAAGVNVPRGVTRGVTCGGGVDGRGVNVMRGVTSGDSANSRGDGGGVNGEGGGVTVGVGIGLVGGGGGGQAVKRVKSATATNRAARTRAERRVRDAASVRTRSNSKRNDRALEINRFMVSPSTSPRTRAECR